MRGETELQGSFLTIIDLEARVPTEQPIRSIKKRFDAVLAEMSPHFDALYSGGGRPSVPPEQLLKARVLMALYSVRSERLFCEQLGCNLLWLWFMDRSVEEGSFDHSVLAKKLSKGAQ